MKGGGGTREKDSAIKIVHYYSKHPLEMGGHEVLKPTKYRTIHDIPDELIPTYSKRDPDNMLYKTRRWVNFKKKQILFQQQDGVPNYLRTPASRALFYTMCGALAVQTVYNIYMLNSYLKKK